MNLSANWVEFLDCIIIRVDEKRQESTGQDRTVIRGLQRDPVESRTHITHPQHNENKWMTHVHHRPVCVVVGLDESFRNTSSEVSTPPRSSNTSRMQNPVIFFPRSFQIYRPSVPNGDIVATVNVVLLFPKILAFESTNPFGIGTTVRTLLLRRKQ